MKKRKRKAIAAKRQRAKREINLFSKKEEYYKSDNRDEIDLDQTNNKYLLQLQKAMKKKLQVADKVVYSFATY